LSREVNIDNNTVGWYTSLDMGSFAKDRAMIESTVDTQFNYQERIGDKSVVLFYDQIKSLQGIFALRAFKLTQNFMQLWKSQTFTKEK
jgi:translation initiation factor 3 subunit H